MALLKAACGLRSGALNTFLCPSDCGSALCAAEKAAKTRTPNTKNTRRFMNPSCVAESVGHAAECSPRAASTARRIAICAARDGEEDEHEKFVDERSGSRGAWLCGCRTRVQWRNGARSDRDFLPDGGASGKSMRLRCFVVPVDRRQAQDDRCKGAEVSGGRWRERRR